MAGVVYQAFGDVVAGALALGCTEEPFPIFADVQINCTIGALSGLAQFVAPPATFVAQSAGSVTIWMDPTSSNSTDPNLGNNRHTDTLTVNATEIADLAVITATESADTIEVSESVTYQATLENFGPYLFPVAGVAYQAFGNVVAGALAPGCTEEPFPIFADVQINCTIGALSGLAQFVAPPATFVAQDTGSVTIWMDPTSSNSTDPNTGNNRLTETFTVQEAVDFADLSVISATESADTVEVSDSVTYQATIENFGPYLFPVAGVAYQAFGNVVAGSLAPGCVEEPAPAIADVQIECTIGALSGLAQFVAPPATFVAQGTGSVTIWMDPLSSNSTDPNVGNNRLTETFTVVAPGPTPIAVGAVIDGVLPAPGLVDTYEFDGLAGQLVRIHLSMLTGSTGTARLIVRAPSPFDSIFPVNLEGRATDLSSANEVILLPATGSYVLEVDPTGTGPYRVGLGTGAGRLDGAYGPAGLGVVTGPTGSGNTFGQMAMDGDDVVIVGELVLTRYDANGDPAAGFGTAGEVDLRTVTGANISGRALAIQPDGKIVVAGSTFLSPYPWAIARFDATGALDPTFGSGGLVQVQLGTRSSSRPLGIGFLQDGASLDIIVGGNGGALQEQIGIIRLNSDGSLDAGFGTGGIVHVAGGIGPSRVVVQSDGATLLASTTDIVRYTSSGALDVGFGVGGLVDLPTGINGLTLLPDGDMLVMGTQSGDATLRRLNSDGTPDGAFAGGGFTTYDFGLSDMFTGAAQDPSGNLIVVGRQITADGDREFLVTRMSQAGALDASFGHGGYLLEHRVDEARAVGFDTQGRILVGGQRIGSVIGIHLTRHLPN